MENLKSVSFPNTHAIGAATMISKAPLVMHVICRNANNNLSVIRFMLLKVIDTVWRHQKPNS